MPIPRTLTLQTLTQTQVVAATEPMALTLLMAQQAMVRLVQIHQVQMHLAAVRQATTQLAAGRQLTALQIVIKRYVNMAE